MPYLVCENVDLGVAVKMPPQVIGVPSGAGSTSKAGSIAYCQGQNAFVQLGIGWFWKSHDACEQAGGPGLNCSMHPNPVLGGWNFTALSLGNTHSCGIAVSGALYCWGNNFLGQVGAPTTNEGFPGRVKEPVN
jgi:alpha-tubulin suppressor-like RCC1 family protein